jgi:hypothetical protein
VVSSGSLCGRQIGGPVGQADRPASGGEDVLSLRRPGRRKSPDGAFTPCGPFRAHRPIAVLPCCRCEQTLEEIDAILRMAEEELHATPYPQLRAPGVGDSGIDGEIEELHAEHPSLFEGEGI